MLNNPSIQEDIEAIYDSADTADLVPSENGRSGCGKCAYACCHPRGSMHRFVALFFMCFLSFGSYFCYDNPAALENQFKNDLNITVTEYSALNSVYSWPNVVLCFIGGYLIDRVFGVRLGTNIYVTITLLGQLIVATGAIVNLYWLVLVGRFVFGIGGESLAVGQNNYAVLWFKGKELNMVFGLQLSFARVGSAVNFNVMDSVYKWVNNEYSGAECLGVVLYLAALTCVFSFVCSLILGALDKRAEDVLRRSETRTTEVVSLKDIRYFGLTFWFVCVICVTYYVAIFPFISLGKDFFKDKFKFSDHEADEVNSLVYLISAFASPGFGYLIDLTGKNILWISIAICGTITAHALLAFTFLSPYAGMILMGITYSILASSLWPLVSLIIPEYQLGTAYGVCQAVQNLGLAIMYIITGLIVDNYGYRWLEIFFIICLLVAFLSTLGLWVADRHRSAILNMTPGDRKLYHESMAIAATMEREKLLSAQPGSPSSSGDYMRVSSDALRNRYLYKIGAPLPPNVGPDDDFPSRLTS